MNLPGTLPVPSLAPRADAVYPALPLGAYRLLYELLNRFTEGVMQRPLTIPMRIYLDRADEFVSLSGIRRLRRGGQLPRTRLLVAPEKKHRSWPAHMLADPESMGRTLWEDLRRYLVADTQIQHRLR
jgi:hypothetical protein